MPLHNHQPLTRDEVWQMLSYISAHGREDWIRIGMALKSVFGDDGFSLFDEWSQTADNYSQKSVKAVWRSFKDGSITIGSLIHTANENGYRSNATKAPAPKITQAPKPVKSDTKVHALKMWLAARFDDSYIAGHQYAKAKGIDWAAGVGRGNASGSLIGKGADCLIVPIRAIETNKVQGVQCINAEAIKQTFGSVSGGALVLGNTLDKKISWYVAEGWASAVSMVFHHHKGNAVCAASFGKGRQHDVADLIAQTYQPDEIVILVEDDS